MEPANLKWVQYNFQLNVWDLNPSIKWDPLIIRTFLKVINLTIC